MLDSLNGPTWPESLDVDALLALGWRPTPFHEFVLKIHSRCDLACDYCYMYTMADQSWRNQPSRMSAETLGSAVTRIAEHCARHNLRRIRIILHGGEPLLAGEELLSYLVTNLRTNLPTGTIAMISVQTNGLHLSTTNLRLLDDLGIQIGVSLDGTAVDHDRHRHFSNGRGSYAAITAGIQRLSSAPYRHLFRGLLCTVDLQSNPISTYETLTALNPPSIDLLLPHRNWSSASGPSEYTPNNSPYADWLIEIFERWYSAPRQRTHIRMFEAIMSLSLGGSSLVEGLGLDPIRILVIDTDGSILQSDFLKSAYQGADRTGLHVRRDSFDLALLSSPIAARQLGSVGLCATCRLCRSHHICGGGHYAHRYRSGYGFDNPSSYCADMLSLIGHIVSRLRADVMKLRQTP